jgi:hypothetical protein
VPGWDSAPQAHSRVLNINFDIWIFFGGLYKYPMKNCQPTAKYLPTWGINQRYCPGLKDTTDTPRSESYIDIHLDINSAGRLKTKLYYKRDDFNCELSILYIATFQQHLHMEYIYISQVIWYSKACGSYNDFLDWRALLTRKLLNKGFLMIKLKASLRTFYGRHHELVNSYGLSQMTTDMFRLS